MYGELCVLTVKPTSITICFVEDTVTLKGREPIPLTVYSSIPMDSPVLIVNEMQYTGTFVEDKKHARFMVESIRRKGDYTAEFRDRGKTLASEMVFHVQKKTQSQDFGLNT